jgi:hypothetical protein
MEAATAVEEEEAAGVSEEKGVARVWEGEGMLIPLLPFALH